MRARGFTLLELLVAVAVFAVAAAMAWGGLDAVARARRALADEGTQLARLQRGIGRFERDLRQAVPQPARGEPGEPEPALRGDAAQLTLSVLLPPDGWASAAPVVQRVRWSCAEGELRRARASMSDRASATPRQEQTLLDKLDDCRLRYVPEQGGVQDRWPPSGAPADALPRAVEIDFRIDGRGRFRRLVELPSAPAAVAP